MLELTEKSAKDASNPTKSVSLPWEKRIKSRLRVTLSSGEEAGIFLPRGTVLRGGDILAGTNGEEVLIQAAPESVSTVKTRDSLLAARLCYHLGNRHVALEITGEYLRYGHDHVLDEMVRLLGGSVTTETVPFEPEHGAYAENTSHGHHHHEP